MKNLKIQQVFNFRLATCLLLVSHGLHSFSLKRVSNQYHIFFFFFFKGSLHLKYVIDIIEISKKEIYTCGKLIILFRQKIK